MTLEAMEDLTEAIESAIDKAAEAGLTKNNIIAELEHFIGVVREYDIPEGAA